MTRCWSCGAEGTGGIPRTLTCPSCAGVQEAKKIREGIESSGVMNFTAIVEASRSSLGEMAGISEAGFEGSSEGRASIASVLEWSFERSEWKLDQMRGALRSIDDTLKTPSQSQANEWRQIAEELRERGAIDESERFFLKSLESNPLDYRTYIGLGKTYLQMGRINEARTYWEKSLPHAPKAVGFDYKSYSYRLIGRAYFCEEDYQQAVLALGTAIELSPDYYLGHYDYAQYCALIGGGEHYLDSLIIAVIKEPLSFQLVRKEKNFERCKEQVEEILEDLGSSENIMEGMKLRGELKSQVNEAENQVNELYEAISRMEGGYRDRDRDRVYYWTAVSQYDGASESLKSAHHIMNELPRTGVQLYEESAEVRNVVRHGIYEALEATWWALTGRKSLGMMIHEDKRDAISVRAVELDQAIGRGGRTAEVGEADENLACLRTELREHRTELREQKTGMREVWKRIEEDEIKRSKWEEIETLRRSVGQEVDDDEEEGDFE